MIKLKSTPGSVLPEPTMHLIRSAQKSDPSPTVLRALSNKCRIPFRTIALSILVGCALSASGAWVTQYDVQHTFDITFRGANAPNIVRGFDSGEAYATSPVGTDFDLYNNPGFVPPRVDNAMAAVPFAQADAHSSVAGAIVGNRLTGSTRAWGSASASQPPTGGAFAYASSKAGLVAVQQVRIPFWGIVWRPDFYSIVGGSASAVVPPPVHDPISFEVFDLGGNLLLDGSLLNIVSDNTLGVEWDSSDILHFNNVQQGKFRIDMDSSYIDPADRGTLFVEFAGGVLVAASDTGRFDNLLPSIGTAGPFSIDIGELDFEVTLIDFGTDVNAHLNLDGSGGAAAAAGVPVPESRSALGMLVIGMAGTFLMRRVQKRTA